MSEGLTRFLVSEHLSNVHNAPILTNLKEQVTTLEDELRIVNDKLKLKDKVIEAHLNIDTVQAERLELTQEQIKQMKRQKVGDWFRNHYKMVVIGVGGLGIGFGVGYLAK